jgi:peptidylprolyl isomerase
MTRFASVLMLMALLIGSIFMSACSTEEVKAKEGDTVKVFYTGTLDDGTVFDSSESQGGDPLEFIIGEGLLLPSFEQAVVGLSIDESITVHIPADEAYGPLEVVGNLDQFPEDEPPQVGELYQIGVENDIIITAEVIEISGSRVTLHNTHQLAGEDLTFEIQLVEILQPTITMSCEQARDAIQEALTHYHDEYGKWPTADGQPGDIVWTKLVPNFMEGTPSNDSDCNWWVNSDPEGEVCLQNTC